MTGRQRGVRLLLAALVAVLTVAVFASTGADANAPVLRGDVNSDGLINSIDAFHLIQHEAGLVWPDPNPEVRKIADVNEDGLLNSLDATLILQFHAGLIGSL